MTTPRLQSRFSSSEAVSNNQIELLQKEADKHLDSTNLYSLGDRLSRILESRYSSLLLELFLIGLKKRTSDIQLPSVVGNNPLNACIGIEAVDKLGILLKYGSNPNREFHVKDVETQTISLAMPTLFVAFSENYKAEIRLLVIYGANLKTSLDKIPKLNEEDLERYQRYKANPKYNQAIIFYNYVESEINSLRQKDADAQTKERTTYKNFRLNLEVFHEYRDIGDAYLMMGQNCGQECHYQESVKPLSIFYMAQSLLYFEKGLNCIEQYTKKYKSHARSAEESKDVQGILKGFYDSISDKCKFLQDHPLYYKKMNEFLHKVNIQIDALEGLYHLFSSDGEENNSSPEETLRHRLLSSSPTNINRSSDSDEYKSSLATRKSF
jgi:hypothetical protein